MVNCTVAIPVYNREDMIERAVSSALCQNIDGLEVLVIDNQSTDRTWEVLQAVSDPRLRLLRNENNIGLFGNFNQCLRHARGACLRFLCSDDQLVQGCLQREMEILDAHPGIVVLSTRGELVDLHGRVMGPFAEILPSGIYSCELGLYACLWTSANYGRNALNYPSGVLLRRVAAQRAGEFCERLKFVGDLDYFFRVLEHGDLGIADFVSCRITIHPRQESAIMRGTDCMIRELADVFARYRCLLKRRGAWHTLIRQLAAISVGFALQSWRRGNREASRIHYAMAKELSASHLGMACGLARLLMLRATYKLTGVRLLPVAPIVRL